MILSVVLIEVEILEKTIDMNTGVYDDGSGDHHIKTSTRKYKSEQKA